VTRQTGQEVRQYIEANLKDEPEGRIVVLDFSGVGIIDYSCADEVVAKLIGRLIGNEYGDKFVLLKNLDITQRENIQVALERKGLAALFINSDSKFQVLGKINPYLAEVLNIVAKSKQITARELADLTRDQINSASTKLLNLYKAKLLSRQVRLLPEGGRQFVYNSLG
jgi:hypothetical protein